MHSTSTVTGKDFAVVRYNSNGSLDNTFGNNGVVITDLQTGSEDVAYSVTLQADGKIILAGYSDNGSNKDAAMVRYKTDGVVDSTFGNNGIVITNFESSQQDEIKVVKIHPLTGNIIVGGSTIISSSLSKPVVARYLSNGTLDTTLNGNGIRLLWITSTDNQFLFSVEDLVVQANGKISAVGWKDFPGSLWNADYWACRINSNGTMDVTFSGDGVNTYNGSFNGNDRAYAMLLKPNNNILIGGGGFISTLNYDFIIAELNANGSVGPWSASVDWGTLLDDVAYALAEDNNGKFVLAGTSGNSTTKTFALTRINTNASIDNTFGNNGLVTTTFGSNALNECFDMAIQADHKIVAIGYTGSDFAIARYLGDAVPDLNTFQLIAPANASTNQNYPNVVFDWTDAFGATSYEIEIDTSPNFTSSQTYTNTSSNYAGGNLLSNTLYYWRVRASDGTNWGAYSNVWSFTTNSLENFNLISPANSSTNQAFSPLTLKWSNNVGATNYELQIDTSQSFTTSPLTYTSSTPNYTATLLPSKKYYWKVRAGNGSNWSQWTMPWSFTTKADPASSIHETYFADVKIYPNPTSNLITVETNNFLLNKPFKLLDNTGKEIYSGVINSGHITVKLDRLSTGIYLLQIGDYPQQTFKVVKE